jgi:hypothetical protein
LRHYPRPAVWHSLGLGVSSLGRDPRPRATEDGMFDSTVTIVMLLLVVVI